MNNLIKTGFNGIIGGIEYHFSHKFKYGLQPTYMVFEITQRCNSKCVMCNVWKGKDRKEFTIKEISKVFSNDFFNCLRWIDVTGGEPFLRADLIEIIKILNKLDSLEWITINTNGFLTQKITADIKKILKILRPNIILSLSLSIDGLYKTHDRIRGTSLAYNKAINTLINLKKIKNKNFDLKIESVISKVNINQLDIMEKRLKEYCPNITFTYPTISKGYFRNKKNKEIRFNKKENIRIINFLKNIKSNSIIYNFYLNNLIRILNDGKRKLSCLGGYKTVFLDAECNLFPCALLSYKNSNFKFGNCIYDNPNNIWNSIKGRLIRKELKRCKICQKCVFSCDIINNIKEEFFEFVFFLICHPSSILKFFRNK